MEVEESNRGGVGHRTLAQPIAAEAVRPEPSDQGLILTLRDAMVRPRR